jgi:hypothetical protein
MPLIVRIEPTGIVVAGVNVIVAVVPVPEAAVVA